MCWLYGLDALKGNIYIDVLCANEEVEWRGLYKYGTCSQYEAKSNCVSEGDGKREGLRMMTIIHVADMITNQSLQLLRFYMWVFSKFTHYGNLAQLVRATGS